MQRGGGNVDALGDLGVAVAGHLAAEQPAAAAIGGQAHVDVMRLGVVAVVIGRGDRDGAWVEPGGLVVAQAGAGDGQVEHLDHLRAERAAVLAAAAECVLGSDPPLLVRGGAEWQVAGRVKDGVMGLGAVARCPDPSA